MHVGTSPNKRNSAVGRLGQGRAECSVRMQPVRRVNAASLWPALPVHGQIDRRFYDGVANACAVGKGRACLHARATRLAVGDFAPCALVLSAIASLRQDARPFR